MPTWLIIVVLVIVALAFDCLVAFSILANSGHIADVEEQKEGIRRS